MGSLDEEALIQMVHEFIESDSSSANFGASSNGVAETQTTIVTTLQEILLDTSKAEKKVLEKVQRHMRSRTTGERISSNLRNWLVMEMNMEGIAASLRQTSWVTSFGCPGEYEYIGVGMRHGNGERTKLVVDIDFRSQFELARPTPLYKRLTDTLPMIFVGTEDKLCKIISLLCVAAKQSLEERGLHVPPWRTTTYMRCKWLSTSNSNSNNNNNNGVITSVASAVGGSGDPRLGFGKWLPPVVGPRRGDNFRGGSGLSSQFNSSLSINCC